jgi:P pilus assembly chaperone PapD
MSTIVTSLCSLCFHQNYVVRIKNNSEYIHRKINQPQPQKPITSETTQETNLKILNKVDTIDSKLNELVLLMRSNGNSIYRPTKTRIDRRVIFVHSR